MIAFKTAGVALNAFNRSAPSLVSTDRANLHIFMARVMYDFTRSAQGAAASFTPHPVKSLFGRPTRISVSWEIRAKSVRSEGRVRIPPKLPDLR